MKRWIRFEHDGRGGFGTLEGDVITVHEGDMFAAPGPTASTLALADVRVLTPCDASKMIGLWNNFHALAAKLDLTPPGEPLYFIKTSNSYLASGGTIRRPGSYAGKVIFEGELGIVMGRTCSAVSEAEAADYVFGYTCVNDVTAVDLLKKDPTFDQWVRAKSFDTFGAFGPVVVSGIDPAGLTIRSILNGAERQNYPVSDMIHSPARLVSMISHDMTLYPGDVIACGTSVGVGSMKEPRNTIDIVIDGIGTLANVFEQ